MTLADVSEHLLSQLPNLFEYSQAESGTISICTPLTYPDGDYIEVFLEEVNGSVWVSDFGEAIGWMRQQGLSRRLSSRQLSVIDDIVMTLGVTFQQGEIRAPIADGVPGETLHRVAQASLQLADTWYWSRRPRKTSLHVQVSELLEGFGIKFREAVQIEGRSGRQWTIDYAINNGSADRLMSVLSTTSKGSARGLADRAVARCTDLQDFGDKKDEWHFVSLINDDYDVWREQDRALIAQVSRVVHWSERDKLSHLVMV